MADPTPEEIEAKAKADAEEADVKAKADADAEAAKKKVADDDVFDKDRAMATINKLRDEVKASKADVKRMAELEEKLTGIENAQLSDQERVAKERDALAAEKTAWEQERQATNLKLAVYAQAVPLGIVDADLALAALDRSQVEYDEAGAPKNIADVLLTLLEAKPILKGSAVGASGTGSTNAGGGQGGGKAPSLTAAELEAAQKLGMTPESYAAMRDVNTVGDYEKAREGLKTPA